MVAIGICVSAYAQFDEYSEAISAYRALDFDKAGSVWQKLAEEGDVHAQYALGIMELRSEVENASPDKAFYWLLKAAIQEHPSAMFNVGVAYWNGTGIKQDREQAVYWWEQSAQAGVISAQFNLGLAYYLKVGPIPQNLELALKWVGAAARQNHSGAQEIYDSISILVNQQRRIRQNQARTRRSPHPE